MFKALLVLVAALCIVSCVSAQENSGACDVCLSVVTYAEQYVNQSEPEIQKALVKACSYLPPQLEGLCDTVVLVYGHQIIQNLLNKATPQQVCQKIKLCPNNTVEEIKITPVVEEPAKPVNDVKCTLCTLIVSTAENFISKNESEAKIEEQVKKACGLLPSSLRTQCNDLVHAYLPQIIDLLKEKYPPTKVCAVLGLCTGLTKTPCQKKVVPTPSNDNCQLCHFVVDYVENYIAQNTTTQKIIEALQQVCAFAPPEYQITCKALLPVVWSQIIQSILQKENSTVVCKQLHLCPAVAPVEVSNPLICAGCKQLVSIAHNFLVANSTEQKIIEAVEKACNYFPEQYKGLCMIVVEQYGRQIVEQLANKVLEPNAVCTAVKACPTKLKTYKQMFISKLANGKL